MTCLGDMEEREVMVERKSCSNLDFCQPQLFLCSCHIHVCMTDNRLRIPAPLGVTNNTTFYPEAIGRCLCDSMQQTNKVSLATARCMPVILALIVIYASYVVIGPLTINYFLNPPRDDISKRLALGIAILVVYFVLLIPIVLSYIRLLLVVLLDPGYVELGTTPKPGVNEPQPGLEEFYNRDAFVCDENGLPIWCGFCNNYKHDRGHHNQDTGRCTYKMDHFCPWVGGVVGER